MKLLDRVNAVTRKLTRAVADAANTKLDIKEVTKEIQSVLSQMTTVKMIKMLQVLQTTEYASIIQTEIISAEKNDMGTQTEKEESVTTACQTTCWMQGDDEEELKEALDKEEKTIEQFEKIRHKNWPEDIYVATKPATGAFISKSDIAFWEDDKDTRSRMIERHPEAQEMGGPVGLLSVVSRKKDKGGRVETSGRKIFKLTSEATAGERLNTLKEFKSSLMTEGITGVALHAPNKNVEIHRKLVEYMFHKSDISVVIHHHKGKEEIKRAVEEGIVIRQGNASYADLLRKVKTAVGVNNKGIKQVRKTKDGAVLLVLDKKENRVGDLKKTIEENIEGAKTRRAIREVADLDPTITKQEVEAAVKERLGATEHQVEITKMNQNRFGDQMALVAIDRDLVAEARQITRLKIGLAPCRIREWQKVQRCFRCWDYGHEARECKG